MDLQVYHVDYLIYSEFFWITSRFPGLQIGYPGLQVDQPDYKWFTGDYTRLLGLNRITISDNQAIHLSNWLPELFPCHSFV